MLMSLGAVRVLNCPIWGRPLTGFQGAFGLNLTTANNVVLMDPCVVPFQCLGAAHDHRIWL